MRLGVGDNSTWTNALASYGISTGVLARFDFASGSQFVWTGSYQLPVSGTSDSLADGNTFQPISNGVVVDVGGNSFSMSGSEALVLTLAMPTPPTAEMSACIADANEWQGRAATLWRIVWWQAASATAPAQYVIARVRAGAMDTLQISNDGSSHTFALTIEAHASMISNASGSTYLDQKTKFDSADTSQDYALSIANNPRGPGNAGTAVGGPVYSGGGGGIAGSGSIGNHVGLSRS